MPGRFVSEAFRLRKRKQRLHVDEETRIRQLGEHPLLRLSARYRTDVNRIEIDGDTVRFFRDGNPLEARYASDGHEILKYEAGNRGVRFIFKKTEGDAKAPQYIQFSDHKIAPAAADHYHLYWGDDRAALLAEVTNWPTYYPSSMGTEQIVREMIAH